MPDKTSSAPELRVLSLWQPWASLMALRQKQWETRSWQTNFRGWVAIHAAARWNRDLARICLQSPFREVLAAGSIADGMPLGKVLAVGRLDSIVATSAIKKGMLATPYEANFGDYTPCRFGWHFTDVRELPLPIPLKASQGLFRAPELLRHQILQQCPDLKLS